MILFSVGKFSIYTWGMMVNLGFFVALFVAYLEARRKKMIFFDIFVLSILIYTSGIIGAWAANFWLQKSAVGFMFIGGAIVAFAVSVFYAKSVSFLRRQESLFIAKEKTYCHAEFISASHGDTSKNEILKQVQNDNLEVQDDNCFWRLADIIIVAAPFGMFFGRIGCLVANDHLGSFSFLPWAIAGRHPVILYLLINLAIMIVLLNSLKYKIETQGLLFLVGVVYYSVTRFVLDFFRCSDLWICDLRFRGLTATQWTLVPIFLISVVFLIKICYIDKNN